ncbi:MAG: mercury transporter MerT, partial [Rhodothermia bacterium]|nr:mercury transporter MerT [Rhodothermia bacterium]
MGPANTNRARWSVLGAVSAALAATACCTVPLLLVSAGVGGAWMSGLTAMVEYRPLFIALAIT